MDMASSGTHDEHSLEGIFQQHIENSLACHAALGELFANLGQPLPYITRVKQLEARGDRLTAAAYGVLESWELSGLTHITEDLVKRLDDIVDGFNDAAQLIDIFHSEHFEVAANDILAVQQAMLTRLQRELSRYPDNELGSLRDCCTELKVGEEQVDQIYHQWRRKERRVLELSLIEENNWTELFGVLEQTTDDIYHTALVLERIAKYRRKANAAQAVMNSTSIR